MVGVMNKTLDFPNDDPWLDEDHTSDTQKFVTNMESQIINWLVAHTGRDKLTRDDAVNCERKFVDPFVCTICMSVAQDAI